MGPAHSSSFDLRWTSYQFSITPVEEQPAPLDQQSAALASPQLISVLRTKTPPVHPLIQPKKNAPTKIIRPGEQAQFKALKKFAPRLDFFGFNLKLFFKTSYFPYDLVETVIRLYNLTHFEIPARLDSLETSIESFSGDLPFLDPVPFSIERDDVFASLNGMTAPSASIKDIVSKKWIEFTQRQLFLLHQALQTSLADSNPLDEQIKANSNLLINLTQHTLHGIACAYDESFYERELMNFLGLPRIFEVLKLISEMENNSVPVYLQNFIKHLSLQHQARANIALIFDTEKPKTFLYLRYNASTNSYLPTLSGNFDIAQPLSANTAQHFTHFFSNRRHPEFYHVHRKLPVTQETQKTCEGTLFWLKHFVCSTSYLKQPLEEDALFLLIDLYFSILKFVPQAHSVLEIRNKTKSAVTEFSACLFQLVKLGFNKKTSPPPNFLEEIANKILKEWPKPYLDFLLLGVIENLYRNFSLNFRVLYLISSLLEARASELADTSLETIFTWCCLLYQKFVGKQNRQELLPSLLDFKKLIEKILASKKQLRPNGQMHTQSRPEHVLENFAGLFKEFATDQKLKYALEIHLKEMLSHFKRSPLLLLRHLQANSLQWSFDISSESFSPLFEKVVSSVHRSGRYTTANKLNLIGAIIVYFNIYDSCSLESSSSAETPNATPTQKLARVYLNAVKKLYRPLELERKTLDNTTLQHACFTLFQIKMWELEIHAKNSLELIRFLQSPPQNCVLRPTFLIDQSSRSITAWSYQAVFNGPEIISLSPLPSEEAQNLFSSTLGKTIELESALKYVLSHRDFKQFSLWISGQGEEGPLVLPWLESKVDELPEHFPEPRLYAEKSFSSISNAQEEGFKNDEETTSLRPLVRKRKRLLEESLHHFPFSSSNAPPSNETTQSHFYVDNLTKQHPSKKRKTTDSESRPSGSQIIAPSNLGKKAGFAIESVKDFFNALSKQTLDEFTIKLERSNSRFTVLSNQKPIPYVITERLSAYDQQQCSLPTVWLDNMLMPYQKEIYLTLNKFFKVGLSALLSLEMGAGKTFVSLERVFHHVATDIHTKKIIAVPASVILNYYQECLKGLSEAKVLASSAILKANPEEIREYLNSMDSALARFYKEPTPSLKNEVTSFLKTYALAFTSNPTFSRPSLTQVKPDKLVSLAVVHLDFLMKFSKANQGKLLILEGQLDEIRSSSLLEPKWFEVLENLKNYLKGESTHNPLLTCEISHQNFVSEAQTAELIFFIGALLNLKFNPSKDQTITLEEARRILNYPFTAVVAVQGSKEMLEASKRSDPVILICSHDALRVYTTRENELNPESTNIVLDEEKIAKLNSGLLILDEAQRFHDGKSKKGKWLAAVVQLMRAANTEVLGITGTPFENNFLELVHLISALNPDTISSDAICFLTKLFRDTSSLFTKVDPEEQDRLILTGFAHFLNLANVLKRVVLTKETRSLDVLRDWENLVPQANFLEHRVPLETRYPEVFKAIQICEQSIQGVAKKQLLELESKTKRYLILGHEYYLERVDISHPQVTAFLDSLNSDPRKLNTVVEQSPYLKELTENLKFLELIRNKKKGILFVENLLLGTLIKKLINQKFSDSCKAKFFNGKLTLDERDKATRWFKDNSTDNHGKLLILSIDAGGVGLNLPEAEVVFVLTIDYNPSKEQQAIKRAFRVGSNGQKDVVSFFFENIYIQTHRDCIVQQKLFWIDFLLKDLPLLKKYEIWHHILLLESVRIQLNEDKDSIRAAEYQQEIKSRLGILFFCTSEEDVSHAVQLFEYRPKISDSDAMEIDRPDSVALQETTDAMDVDSSDSLSLSPIQDSLSAQSPLSSSNVNFPEIPFKERLRIGDFFTIPMGSNRRETESLGAFIANAQRTSKGRLPENIDRVLAHFLTQSTPIEENDFASLKEEANIRNTRTTLLNQGKIQFFDFRLVPGFFAEALQPYEKDPEKISVRIIVDIDHEVPHYSLLIRTGSTRDS